jgi:hypothetical protein
MIKIYVCMWIFRTGLQSLLPTKCAYRLGGGGIFLIYGVTKKQDERRVAEENQAIHVSVSLLSLYLCPALHVRGCLCFLGVWCMAQAQQWGIGVGWILTTTIFLIPFSRFFSGAESIPAATMTASITERISNQTSWKAEHFTE